MIRSMKKHILIGIAVIGVTSIIYHIIYISNCLNIDIINKTSSSIGGLVIKSNLLESDVMLPSINVNKEEKIRVKLAREFNKSDGDVILEYKLENGAKEKFVLYGYKKGGSLKNIETTIKEDENGKIYTSTIKKN